MLLIMLLLITLINNIHSQITNNNISQYKKKTREMTGFGYNYNKSC